MSKRPIAVNGLTIRLAFLSLDLSFQRDIVRSVGQAILGPGVISVGLHAARDKLVFEPPPVTDGERVYAYFGMTGLFCFDFRGDLVWEKDLGNYETRAGWGTASSPLLDRGNLYLQIDNQQQSFLTALDAKTGRELWRVDRDEATQYSSPIIWKNSLRSELVVGGMIYRSYDPASGRLLWQLDMAKGRSSATPLAVGDRLFVGTELRNRGGPDDGGGFLFAIKAGGAESRSLAAQEPKPNTRNGL